MELVSVGTIPASGERNILQAVDSVAVSAGEYVQVKYGPAGNPVTLLQEQCPAGKQWQVEVTITVTETDV